VEEIESDGFVGSTTSTRLQCWKEVVGGKSRGRVYGTGDLGANIQPGVTSLTQPSLSRTEDEHARHNERLEQELAETKRYCAMIQEEMKLIRQQLALVLEKQSTNSSTGTSQVHHHYDEDLDDQPILWTWFLGILSSSNIFVQLYGI